MKDNWSEQQDAKSGDRLSEDTNEDQYEDCRWLDELPSQGPVTLTPLDKLLWESLLSDSHQCSGGHTRNCNNHAGWTVSVKANPQLVTVADQTRPTTESTLPSFSTPVADSGLSRFRFQTSPITRPAYPPDDSPLVQASTVCHDMLRTSTLPPAMSHAAPVSNLTVEAVQNKWGPETIGTKVPPKRAEGDAKESALHTLHTSSERKQERTGQLRQTQTSAAACRRLRSGIEVMLSSVATIDDKIGSTVYGSISTMEVTDQLTNSAVSKTPQSARSDMHTDSDNNYDLQSCYRSCSKSRSFPSNATISNKQRQGLQSMDCKRSANSLPSLSTIRQPWQLTTSRRRLFVGQNAPVPSNSWPQAPMYCPLPLWKSATSGADVRSAPAVSTEVTMELSGDSSDEAEFSPSSCVRQQRCHRLPVRVKPSTKRPGFLPATYGSTTTATPFHPAHPPHSTGGPVSLARPPQELGRRFPAPGDRSATSPTTFAKSSYSGSMQYAAVDKFQLATTTINSKTASTHTEQSESTLCPSNGQDARPSLGRGILLSSFCSAMDAGTSLMRIGVNEAVTDDSMAKSIHQVSPQLCCAKTYEVLGFYGAPEPKDIPGMVTIARTRQSDSRSTAAASRIQPRECDSWNSTGCQTDDCLKFGGVQRNRRRRHRRASVQRVSEHATMDSSSGSGFAEWICVTGDQSSGSKSDGNSGSTAATYGSGGDQAQAQAWSSVQRLLLLRPCLPQTAQTQRLHTSQALVRREAGSSCVALARTVVDGQLGCAAAIRLLPADHARFVWLAGRPPRYSRTCCQLLSGPLDNCQPSESGLALLRSPVFAHLRASRGLALGSVDRQPVASSVRVATPEIRTALRFVMPTEAPDAWSPSPCSESRNQQAPIAMSHVPPLPWQQPFSGLFRQPEPAFIPTGAFFHTSSSSNSEPLLNSSPSLELAALANQQSSRRSTHSGSKAQQHRELRRVIRMRMQSKVHQNQSVEVPCCSQSTSEAEDSRSQGCQLGSLEQRLGGLLDSLRDSRKIAAATAASLAGGSLSQQQSPGWRSNFSCVVQRILNESSSQQAALKNLLAVLQGDTAGDCCTGEHHDEKRRSYQSSQSAATSIGSAATSPSEQFFSPATSGLTDAGSRASRRPAARSLVESLKTDANTRHKRSMSMNNNADNASVGTSLSTSVGRGSRHQTFYARRCLIRLEESAALLVQEASCRDSSVVSVCSVHQDDSEENSSCASTVQTAAVAAQQRTQQRLLALQRWTLAQAWQRPPLSDRFLDQMDPTVSSFIWWSLIPLHRRLRPPKDSSNSDADVGLPLQTSSTPPFLPLSEMEVWHDSTSGSVSEDAAIGATTGQRRTIAV